MISAFRSIRPGNLGGSHPTSSPALDPTVDAEVPQDEQELLARAAAGDREALSELYTAHRPMAEHVARRTCRPSDVDDVVSEAFAKVIDQLERGGGPRVSFRAYLITAVRTASADVARRHARAFPTDDIELPQHATGTLGEQPNSTLRLESQLLTTALASLPVRWQLTVWWVTVEGRPLSEVGEKLGINANAAAALAFRAREGLRDAYLALHMNESTDPTCAGWRSDFPALVRSRLGAARTAGATSHLLDCNPCRRVMDSLRQLLLTGVATKP